MNGIDWYRYPNGDVEISTDAGVFLRVEKRIGKVCVRTWYSFPAGEPQKPAVARRLESELAELYAQDEQRYEAPGPVVEARDG